MDVRVRMMDLFEQFSKKIDISRPNLPKLNIPKLDISKLNISKLNIPKLDVSQLNVPRFSVPDFSVPKLNLPQISLPQISLPQISLPSLNLPHPNLPKFSIPPLNLSPLFAPRSAQSQNRALQKQINRLESRSVNLHRDTHAVSPRSQTEVQEAHNAWQAHHVQVQDFKDQPGFVDFLKERGNFRFMTRLDMREQLTKAELEAKELVSSWELPSFLSPKSK